MKIDFKIGFVSLGCFMILIGLGANIILSTGVSLFLIGYISFMQKL